MTETRSTTLADFLLARIAEDEAAARDDYFEFDDHVYDGVPFGEGSCIYMSIGRRRVLAECEAKRRIVALHQHAENQCWEMHHGIYPADWPAVAPWGLAGEPWAHPSLESLDDDEPCETLRLLALPYADAPGYRDEWRP